MVSAGRARKVSRAVPVFRRTDDQELEHTQTLNHEILNHPKTSITPNYYLLKNPPPPPQMKDDNPCIVGLYCWGFLSK